MSLTHVRHSSFNKVAFKLLVESIRTCLWVLRQSIAFFLVLAEAAALFVFTVLLVALAISIISLSALIFLSTLLVAITALSKALRGDFLLAIVSFLNLLRLIASLNLESVTIIASLTLSSALITVLSIAQLA